MRLFILSAMMILFLGSCSSYQYLSLNSTQMSKNGKKELTWENDTLRVSYNFNGQGGPISISVYNKTDKALFINWGKSALVRDGHAIGLSNPNVQVNGSITTYGRRVSFGNLNASFELPEGVNMVPPASDITKNLYTLVDSVPVSSEYLPDMKEEKGHYADGASYKFRRYVFTEERSPLRFRSYLTFVIGNNPGVEFSVSNSFFADEVITTEEGPAFFAPYRQGGDKLYLKKAAQ